MGRNGIAGFAALALVSIAASAHQEHAMPLVHTTAGFAFDLMLAYDFAAPLFGAKEESKWAPDWSPQFLHPVPAADIEGAVFRTLDGPHQGRLWINTVFDLANGHIQYVYVLNQAIVTRIDIHLARKGANETHVAVTYERTALAPSANDEVRKATKATAAYGPEWRDAIERYAQTVR